MEVESITTNGELVTASVDRNPDLFWGLCMRPHSTGTVYVNDLKEEGAERVRAAYGDKLPRLQSLKRKYDPNNIFRVNQNIAL